MNPFKKRQQNRLIGQMLGIGRKRTLRNMEQIRSVGIVFTVGDESRWNTIYNYAKLLTKEGKEVWICGFQPKNLKLDYIFSYTQSVICHEKEDTNVNGIPKEGVLNGFTAHPYDLLIDMTCQPDFFGKYVAMKTLADLKASYVDTTLPIDDEQEQIFDLMIRGAHPMEEASYLEELYKYLNMVK